MGKKRTKKSTKDSVAKLGLEAKLWLAADKLRTNMDAAEYEHGGLGLIPLMYVDDAFDEIRRKLIAGESDFAYWGRKA